MSDAFICIDLDKCKQVKQKNYDRNQSDSLNEKDNEEN